MSLDDDRDVPPPPARRTPRIVWVALAVLVVLAFAVAATMLRQGGPVGAVN